MFFLHVDQPAPQPEQLPSKTTALGWLEVPLPSPQGAEVTQGCGRTGDAQTGHQRSVQRDL